MAALPNDQAMRTFDTKALQALLAFGSYASLAYLVGYVYQWAYLDVFGATFLLSEVPTTLALFSTAATAGPMVMMVGLVLIDSRTDVESTGLRRFALAATVLSFLTYIADGLVGHVFIERARGVVLILAGVLTLPAASGWAALTLSAWRRGAPIAKRSAAFFATALLLWPLLYGSAEAYMRAASAETDLPVVTLTGEVPRAYLLFVTADNVYCIVPARSMTPGTVLRVNWDAVKRIVGVRENTRRGTRGAG